ncbi:hypothetical protein HMPREF1395_00211 [Helicobacter pylori GAM112Ai]|nr:hypothetical protein HMPREF1395_00211 [Helicobacter pylori GAM112Ai]EMH33019.1 hypothetical protein HMPREF1424_00791 [Helicobacter pylori GAM42Ai]
MVFSQSLHCFRFFNSNNFFDRGYFAPFLPPQSIALFKKLSLD